MEYVFDKSIEAEVASNHSAETNKSIDGQVTPISPEVARPPVQAKEKRRVPVQKRSRQKYDAILAACTVVLMREGYNGTTTSNIAKEAGVAIGSLYEYFPNKETIFAAYLETRIEAVMSLIQDIAPEQVGKSPEEAIRILLRVAVSASQKNRDMIRVVVNEVPGVLDLPSIQFFEEKIMSMLRTMSLLESMEINEDELELKIYVLANSIFGFLLRSFFSSKDLDVDETTDELIKLIFAYSKV